MLTLIYFQAKPKYQFKYEVDSYKTGDKQFHEESREGDSTKGKYELKNPYGTLVAVDYTIVSKQTPHKLR